MRLKSHRPRNTSARVGSQSKIRVERGTSLLRYLRRMAGLSQRQLAEEVGLTSMDISYFEAGYRSMQLWKVQRLAAYFDISIQTLVDDDFGTGVEVCMELS